MGDYAARFDCYDSVIFFTEPSDGIQLALESDDLTEAKIFVNSGKGTYHTALDLMGAWLASHKFKDHNELAAALFEPGAEDKFTMFRIERPKGPGESGFAEFEVALDVADSWCVKTNRGVLSARRIQLAMRLTLDPVH